VSNGGMVIVQLTIQYIYVLSGQYYELPDVPTTTTTTNYHAYHKMIV